MTFDLDSPAADDSDKVCFTVWEVYAIILPVLIGLTFLPSFKILAFSAYIGSIFLVLAVSVSQYIPLSLSSLFSHLSFLSSLSAGCLSSKKLLLF